MPERKHRGSERLVECIIGRALSTSGGHERDNLCDSIKTLNSSTVNLAKGPIVTTGKCIKYAGVVNLSHSRGPQPLVFYIPYGTPLKFNIAVVYK